MSYLGSRLFYIQLGVQFLLCAIAVWLPDAYLDVSLHVFMLFLLATLGVPHGANDFLYRKDKSMRGSVRFLSLYLGTMAAYAVLWYFAGVAALLLFFAISVFHFGQANFEESGFFNPESLLWGFLVILWPVAFSAQEAFAIFEVMIDNSFQAPSRFTLISVAVFFTLIYLIITALNRKKHFFKLLLQMGLLIGWFYMVPLIPGFVIVFSLWHALQSMTYQYNFYVTANKNKRAARRTFWINMVVFSLISLLFLAGYVYFFDFHVGALFILLSLITLPHVFVMDGLYKNVEND